MQLRKYIMVKMVGFLTSLSIWGPATSRVGYERNSITCGTVPKLT